MPATRRRAKAAGRGGGGARATSKVSGRAVYRVGAEAEERGAGGDQAEGANAAGNEGRTKENAQRSAAAVHAGHRVLETVGEEVECLLKTKQGNGKGV